MSRRFARRYAKALLVTIRGDDDARAARDDVATFVEAMEAVPGLGRMATSPAVPVAVKQSIVTQVCEKLAIGNPVQHLIALLTRNYRLVHLTDVLAAIDEVLNHRLGIVTAEVTSAQPLDEDQRRALERVLVRLLGSEVELHLATDPKLLAGFVARIGSRRYDASLSGQLDRLASTPAEAD